MSVDWLASFRIITLECVKINIVVIALPHQFEMNGKRILHHIDYTLKHRGGNKLIE